MYRFYVDDILVTDSSSIVIDQLLIDLGKEFVMKDLGELYFFLGIQASIKKEDIMLSQEQYISHRSKTNFAKSSSTQIAYTQTNDDYPYFDDPTLYTSIVGSFQYATTTRPDIGYAFNRACQHIQSPTEM
ncbi:uncharacterized protein LOC113280726 [Papaver somniferum]|uniref:uncharacterized protein LOC113280726 n=1 Tax=Papaver somniferum TaxID=3469 RepID=UPI000E6FF7FD|nr:uncharacterized protein LOC113280726 [Papaver somniferum]